jgi:hypothetical protein
MLDVNGATNINTTLRVVGLTTLANTSNTGTLGVAGLATFVNTSNTGIMGVAGAATFSSNLSVTQTFTNGRFQIYPVTTNNYTIMALSGGNTTGYIYADFQSLGDGIHMGYNFYSSNSNFYAGNSFANGSSRISMGYGSISLNTGVTSNLSTAIFVASSSYVGINNASPSYPLDVNGPMQAAIFYSTITAGGTMTITPNNFGIFYNISASGSYTLAFAVPPQASSNIGKYICVRNNSGTALSLTLTNVSGIASPVTLSNAQSATFVVATTNTYALF